MTNSRIGRVYIPIIRIREMVIRRGFKPVMDVDYINRTIRMGLRIKKQHNIK